MSEREGGVATSPVVASPEPTAARAPRQAGATGESARTSAPSPTFGRGNKTPRKFWVRSARVAVGASPKTNRRGVEREYHQTIRRIDLWSVLKVSVCFNLCALVVFLTSGVILWVAADTLGLIHGFEKQIKNYTDAKVFKLFPGEILRAATLLGLVFVCMFTVMAVLATAFYNLFSDIVGGVEITVSEEV